MPRDRHSGAWHAGLRCAVAALCGGVLLAAILGVPRAQAQYTAPDEEIKFFIGISRGDLHADSEEHLRAFIVVQKLVERIREQLKAESRGLAEIRTADLKYWKKDYWPILRRMPISHYLVAHPRRPGDENLQQKDGPDFEVEWHLGKFAMKDYSPYRTPVYFAEIKERTAIAIPRESKALAKLKVKRDRGWSDSVDFDESADIIVEKLYRIFPELRKKHLYFVDCFKNEGDTSDFPVEGPDELMSHLSQYLYNRHDTNAPVILAPTFELQKPAWARTMCDKADYKKDKLYRFDDAQFFIDGRIKRVIHDQTPAPMMQPVITIASDVIAQRENLTKPHKRDPRAGEIPPLKEFCLPPVKPAFADMAILTDYVLAHGFRIRQKASLGGRECP